MTETVVFGAAYSVYVRAVRLALEEKAVPYDLVEVDVFADAGPPAGYLDRHPFGRIPAFEHDGFRLYESDAILRYVDEAFDGPSLTPDTPRGRARMTQVMRILDNYAYRSLVWGVFTEQVGAPRQGRDGDQAVLETALLKAEHCLQVLEELVQDSRFLAGPQLSLADLLAAPMFLYFQMAPDGRRLMTARPRLTAWWQTMTVRPSVSATRSPLEDLS